MTWVRASLTSAVRWIGPEGRPGSLSFSIPDETLFVTETIKSDPILSIEDSIPCSMRNHSGLLAVYVAISYTVVDLFEALFSVLWTFPLLFKARFRQSYCHVEEKYADLKNTNWGDPNNKRRIIIDEEEHKYEHLVTRSLHSAMQHIAMDAQFWINAVCINQEDNVAKL